MCFGDTVSCAKSGASATVGLGSQTILFAPKEQSRSDQRPTDSEAAAEPPAKGEHRADKRDGGERKGKPEEQPARRTVRRRDPSRSLSGRGRVMSAKSRMLPPLLRGTLRPRSSAASSPSSLSRRNSRTSSRGNQGMLSRFSSLLVSSANKPEYTAVFAVAAFPCEPREARLGRVGAGRHLPFGLPGRCLCYPAGSARPPPGAHPFCRPESPAQKGAAGGGGGGGPGPGGVCVGGESRGIAHSSPAQTAPQQLG